MRNWTRLLTLSKLAFGALAVSALASCGSANSSAGSAPAGASGAGQVAARVPTSALVSLERRVETDLREVLHGRPALVTLWASWCESCRGEFAALNRLDSIAAANEAVVVAIAIGDDVEKVQRAVTDQRLRYAQLVDPEFHFSDALGVRRVPTNLVIDREGRIVHMSSALDAPTLAAFRAQLRPKPSDPPAQAEPATLTAGRAQ